MSWSGAQNYRLKELARPLRGDYCLHACVARFGQPKAFGLKDAVECREPEWEFPNHGPGKNKGNSIVR